MKNKIFTLCLILLFINGFSQELKFDVRGVHARPLNQETLKEAKSMNDIVPGYPSRLWITSYTSLKVSATCNGKSLSAEGTSEILNAEQQRILQNADECTEVVFYIKYKSRNAATDEIVDNRMYLSYSLIPAIEAEYLGGNEKMKEYLKENAITKISEETSKKIKPVTVRFTVNEQGEIAKAQLLNTSGDDETDKLLLDAVNKMPKWRPAENSKGEKIKRQFDFIVNGGSGGGGC